MVMDSEEIVMSKKRALMSNDNGKNDSVITKENSEPFTNIIESTPLCSKVMSFHKVKENLQTLTNVEPTRICSNILSNDEINVIKSPNHDLCLTTVQSSQDICSKIDFPGRVQNCQPITTVDKNVNDTVHNNISKRKIQNFCSISDNEDEDPFDYIDVDETEEHIIKKPKREQTESIFLPMLSTTSNKNNQFKSVDSKHNIVNVPNSNYVAVNSNSNIAIDPNIIMNLLATAKDTGQFIDTNKHSNKLVRNII